MKFAILISLGALSLGAGACELPQAQFIGRVVNHSVIQRSESVYECTYEIKFKMFRPSSICPLAIGEATGFRFVDTACTAKDGETVSGILTRRGDFLVVE